MYPHYISPHEKCKENFVFNHSFFIADARMFDFGMHININPYILHNCMQNTYATSKYDWKFEAT